MLQEKSEFTFYCLEYWIFSTLMFYKTKFVINEDHHNEYSLFVSSLDFFNKAENHMFCTNILVQRILLICY